LQLGLPPEQYGSGTYRNRDCACRTLGALTRLTALNLWVTWSVEPPEEAAGAVVDCPVLHAMQEIWCDRPARMLRVIPRYIQIPDDARLSFSWPTTLEQPQPLHIKGWQRGWLPAVLAAGLPGGYAMLAAYDSDVDHYLASVAAMSPRQQQRAKYVVWLGREVTPAGFSRLLSCPLQPPLRLQIGTAAQSPPDRRAQLGIVPLLTPTSAHFHALVGVSAPRLVSLLLAGCAYLTDDAVAMLAGACHALTDLRLLGASRLTDSALHSLARGCPRLQQMHITHARVADGGVVAALTLLGELQQMVLGGAPWQVLQQLEVGVQRGMPAADYLQWAVECSRRVERISWRRVEGQ
jgi:hypothetical protein